ncbi:MAG: transglycosylase SLT domain-containing protein, partial [Myxococcota bacterium]
MNVCALLVVSVFIGEVGEPSGKDLTDLETSLTRHTRYRYTADLEGIRKRGVLRVLTRNSSATYFIARGAQRGFQYELASAFAKELGVRVAMVVPPSRTALIEALLTGEGDVIAAGMSLTPSRAEQVRFTTPLSSAKRVVAIHEASPKPLRSLDDLDQFVLHINKGSTMHRDALMLQNALGRPLKIAFIDDDAEMEEAARRVSAGMYEAIVIDDTLLALAQAAGGKLKSALAFGQARPKAWAVHPGAVDLHAAADAFIRKSQRNRLIPLLYARYYRPSASGARRARDVTYRADDYGRISPYDELFREAGEVTGIDWRLLAAVAYTESRFKPNAKSNWGATGLMQVLPNTGLEVGYRDLKDPRKNVMAGAKYLRRLARRFEEDGVSKRQQIRFAVAAYNAGLGHIRDARKLAEQTGRDPDRWFGHVEEALKLKMHRKWHEKTKYGYARATETVKYVSSVQTR